VRAIQRSELPESSPSVARTPTPVARPRPTRPTTAAMYIPTEDEIDSLAKIGKSALSNNTGVDEHSHTWPFASNLEQVAKIGLLCAQVNSASYGSTLCGMGNE